MGANVEAKDNDGWISLASAAWKGHAEVAQLLLEKGANMEAEDSDGMTSLMWAARIGRAEVVVVMMTIVKICGDGVAICYHLLPSQWRWLWYVALMNVDDDGEGLWR